MSEMKHLTGKDFDEAIAAGAVVVDFYADWCGPCRMMAPIFEEARVAYEGKAEFAKVNTDENADIAMKFNIMTIPTLIFFKDGKPVDRVTGLMDKGSLYSKIDAII